MGQYHRGVLLRAVVVGAGGAGREIAAWYRAAHPDADVLGFLDQDISTHGQRRGELEVLGDISWLCQNQVDDVVVGVGSPAGRRTVTAALDELGLTPSTVVHPTAIIGERVTIGDGTIIAPSAILTVDVQVGHCVYINYGAAIGHDTTIGDFSVIAPHAAIAGNVTIGLGVDFGIGASCIQGITIGEGAIIGGGACVTRGIPPRQVAVGVPAKPIKEHERW